jgi:hypothetical protein
MVVLSSENEMLEIYKRLGFGDYVDLCRSAKEGKDIEGRIIDVPRKIASISEVMERKMVNETTNKAGFMTTNYFIFKPTGESLIVLDGPYFTKEKDSALGKLLFDDKSNDWFNCIDGRVLITDEQFEGFRRDKENTLYLTREETNDAHLRGFVFNGKKWNPENIYLEKIIDFVSEGMDINEYLSKCLPLDKDGKMNYTPPIKVGKNPVVLIAYLNREKNKFNTSSLTPWAVRRIDEGNSIDCKDFTFNQYSQFLGIAEPSIIIEAINSYHNKENIRTGNNQYKK